jgi:hypothetical protein
MAGFGVKKRLYKPKIILEESVRKFLHDHVDPGVFGPDAVRTLIAAFDGAWQSILASGARLSAQQRFDSSVGGSAAKPPR